jgi:hypothetical protein
MEPVTDAFRRCLYDFVDPKSVKKDPSVTREISVKSVTSVVIRIVSGE